MATFGGVTGVGTTIETGEITDGAVTNAKVNASAAIDQSKLNLSITNSEVNASAAIVDTKLATISTAGKVSGAALTLLANTPVGAGVIPAANLPSTGGYALHFIPASTQVSPADGATMVMLAGPATAYGTNTGANGGNSRMYIPKAGTVTAVVVHINTEGGQSSAETFTINLRLNDTTDTAVTATAKMDALRSVFSNVAMSVAVVAGDFLQVYWVNPSWATNPLQVECQATVYIAV